MSRYSTSEKSIPSGLGYQYLQTSICISYLDTTMYPEGYYIIWSWLEPMVPNIVCQKCLFNKAISERCIKYMYTMVPETNWVCFFSSGYHFSKWCPLANKRNGIKLDRMWWFYTNFLEELKVPIYHRIAWNLKRKFYLF